MSAFVLAGLGVSVGESDGGGRFVILGTFPPNESLRVHVGPTGTDADPKAQSGVPGRAPFSRDGATLVAYLPVLAPGTYSVYVTNGPHAGVVPGSFTVVKANYRSGEFSVRSTFSPMYAVGPRNLSEVPT